VVPDDLRYTAEHEWIAPAQAPPGASAAADASAGSVLRIGITDFAQDALGDIVYVQLPDPGTQVRAGEPLGEVESTKSVSEVYAPLSGTVVARNDQLGATPELVNTDPYGAGWLVEIAPSHANAVDALLDAAAYRELTEQV
jgi:glycine cleavage system H protein